MTKIALSHAGRRRHGFGILDTFLSLGIAAFALASLMQIQNDRYARDRMSMMAQTLQMVSQSAMSYVKANNTALLNDISSGSSAQVGITGTQSGVATGTLAQSGYIPDDFSPTLPFHQQLGLILRHVAAAGSSPEHIEAMLVTYGGEEIPDRYLGIAATYASGNAGFIPSYDVTGASGTIHGVNGLWSASAADWSTSGITPSSGHLMYDVTPMYTALSPWMNRYDIGIPDANTMHTTLFMNNNNMNNTSEIDAEAGKDIYVHASSGGNWQASPVGSKLDIYGSGFLCADNETDCGMTVSDDGGFYDPNDGWITFYGSYSGGGVRNEGALDVGGDATLAQTTTVSGTITVGQSGSHDGQVTMDGAASSTDADQSFSSAMTLDADSNSRYWLNLNGASGFQGVYANIMAASDGFMSNSNDSYVVNPANESYFNYLSMVEAWVSGALTVSKNLTLAADLVAQGSVKAGGFVTTNGQGTTDLPDDSMTSGLVTDTFNTKSDMSVGGDSNGEEGGAPITMATNGDSNFLGAITNSANQDVAQFMTLDKGNMYVEDGNLSVAGDMNVGYNVLAGGQITHEGNDYIWYWGTGGAVSTHNPVAELGQSCSPPGTFSFTSGYSAMAVCSGGTWRQVETDN